MRRVQRPVARRERDLRAPRLCVVGVDAGDDLVEVGGGVDGRRRAHFPRRGVHAAFVSAGLAPEFGPDGAVAGAAFGF